MAVAFPGQRRNLRRLDRGQRVCVFAPVQAQDTGNTFNLRGLLRHIAAIPAEHRHVQAVRADRQAAACNSRDTGVQRLPIMLGDYEYCAHTATSI